LALDDIISASTPAMTQADDRRAALTVRRVARVVAVPALVLMLGGLLAYGISSGQLLERGEASLPGPGVESLALLTGSGSPLAGGAAMSVGLLALALTPVITVFWILIGYLRGRRWREAAVAATIVAIMALSAVLGKK
jgi:hypothetical protein